MRNKYFNQVLIKCKQANDFVYNSGFFTILCISVEPHSVKAVVCNLCYARQLIEINFFEAKLKREKF